MFILVSCEYERTPFCCGAYELGVFSQVQFRTMKEVEAHYNYRHYRNGFSNESIIDCWKKELLRHMDKTASYQFWFVKINDGDEEEDDDGDPIVEVDEFRPDYENKELMELVMSLPGSVCIAPEHRNQNSNNLIQGWIVFNNEAVQKALKNG